MIKGVKTADRRNIGFINTVSVGIGPALNGNAADKTDLFAVAVGIMDFIITVKIFCADPDRIFEVIRAAFYADICVGFKSAIFYSSFNNVLRRGDSRKRFFKGTVTAFVATVYGNVNFHIFSKIIVSHSLCPHNSKIVFLIIT